MTVPIAIVTTLVTVFGMASDPGGTTVVGLLSLMALAAIVAAVVALRPVLPGSDASAIRARTGSLRRRAAAVGVVAVRDPDARGRTRPRAPGTATVPA